MFTLEIFASELQIIATPPSLQINKYHNVLGKLMSLCAPGHVRIGATGRIYMVIPLCV